MAKKKKITDENKAFYRLGFLNAENKHQQIVKYLEYENELFKKTNVRLFEDLQRIDKDKPRVGVLITYKLANCLINNVKRGKQNRPLASRLAKRVKEAQKKDAEAVLLSIGENDLVEL